MGEYLKEKVGFKASFRRNTAWIKPNASGRRVVLAGAQVRQCRPQSLHSLEARGPAKAWVGKPGCGASYGEREGALRRERSLPGFTRSRGALGEWRTEGEAQTAVLSDDTVCSEQLLLDICSSSTLPRAVMEESEEHGEQGEQAELAGR
ncbi:hypothetical protein NHX12_025929 [Muraenolepis orangiensis]|uniref:Uncharacterized protein n=1 Tax=Muraenolepis orangiensis TaxID=630683 RepID=A0A9Q0EIY3_9TELE|nr:hypothetical protein NHX12_025929 [Muraenolepis orangiensis]